MDVEPGMGPPPTHMHSKTAPGAAQSSSSSSSSSAPLSKASSDAASGSRKRKHAAQPADGVRAKAAAGPTSRAVKDSNQGCEIKTGSKHFMHLVSNILHNRFNGMVASMLTLVLSPLLAYLDKARTACSTVRGSIEWHMSAAHSSLEFTLGGMWRQLHDISFAQEVGFADALDASLCEEEAKEESALASILLEVLLQVTSYAWASGLQYTS
eukprot:6489135-Amphidinium_carterae.1